MEPKPSTTEKPPWDPDPSTFAFAVTRIASAQICQSVGYTSACRSALNTLTDVAARYLRALASSAASSAASSGRTQSSLHDIVRALEDLASVNGFPGAWELRRPPFVSAALAELSGFVAHADEIPFAKPLPRTPPSPERERTVFKAKGAGVSPVPWWLPAFPEVGEREIGVDERSGVVGSCEEADWGCLVDERTKTGEREIGGGEDRVNEEEEEERNGVLGSWGKVDDGGCLIDEKKKMVGLLEKRGRVRFKLGVGVGKRSDAVGEVAEGFAGVDLRSRVCKGRKRVSCFQNKNVGGTEGEDHRRKKKRRRRKKKKSTY